ncbi:protein of unknown function [Taphrina deformans PYCC 5710]|uniref:Uncharacterized protein n=1 Tax=Taphrina deformans (strain PYCC 5710 / ATCC 11124 / CBS 356.35 / IMI 108563 / JCM 9778 / NBRC 8474) TaxID=1097556 RepID=R4X7R5_TAPDE|nr:protein of unknown function [Taphrina deformans PYCC 5710]|eukprot:CCG81223.1 protein of unknown function [Taphrina deformans PYCC 5710]
MSSEQVPVAQKNFTNEFGNSEHGINYKKEAGAGIEYTGTPASSGETSSQTGQKVSAGEDAPVKQEGTGKTEGSLAEQSKSFGK